MRKEKMNNKGFSLVELIIVIAIMAVLVVVLAPQYLKYVEKSRRSADAAIAAEFESAMSILASDTDVTLSDSETYTVTSATPSGDITISADLVTKFTDAASVDTGKTYKFTSSIYTAQANTIELKYDATKKMWVVTNNCPDINATP